MIHQIKDSLNLHYTSPQFRFQDKTLSLYVFKKPMRSIQIDACKYTDFNSKMTQVQSNSKAVWTSVIAGKRLVTSISLV